MSDSRGEHPVITLLTDFGIRDAYVGVMKGVVAQISPHATMIDLTHDVSPQDVFSAAFLIGRWFRFFPEGSIHLVVVDPGVGTSRKGLVLSSKGHFFVGPDNGVFSYFLDEAKIHSLENPEYWLESVSSTFHGRDIFAPVAAHLAQGCSLDVFGPRYTEPVKLDITQPVLTDRGIEGRIVYVDRFGNLVTNIDSDLMENYRHRTESVVITGEGQVWPLCRTYGDVESGCRCAVIGGFGMLELAVNQGNAATQSRHRVGDRVLLSLKGSQESEEIL